METPEYSTWNNWGVFNNKSDKGEDICRDSDNGSVEINQIEAQRKRHWKKWTDLSDVWCKIKWSKIHVIGEPGDRGRMAGTENVVERILLKIMQI